MRERLGKVGPEMGRGLTVELVGENDKLVLHVDDLIETGFEQVVVIGFFLLLRSHENPQKQCL